MTMRFPLRELPRGPVEKLLWGLIDTAGVVRVPAVFEVIGPASEGLLAIQAEGGKFGVIDASGRIVIEPSFDLIGPFVDGRARARRIVKGKTELGFINTAGEMVFRVEADDVGDFAGGLVRIKTKMGFGLLDKAGKVVVDGCSHLLPPAEGFRVAVRDRLGGLLGPDGAWVLKPIYESLLDVSEGLAGFASSDGLWGFIDTHGKVVIEPRYQAVDSFHEGRARVWLDDSVGYIDKAGSLVVPAQWGEVNGRWGDDVRCHASDGRILVRAKQVDGESDELPDEPKFGYLDTDGKVIVEPSFATAYPFCGGRARVVDERGLAAFIDPSGKAVGGKWWGAMDYHEGFAAVADQAERWGLIDLDGNVVVTPAWKKVEPCCRGLARVMQNDTWSLIDMTGRVLVDGKAEGIEVIGAACDGLMPFRRRVPDEAETNKRLGELNAALAPVLDAVKSTETAFVSFAPRPANAIHFAAEGWWKEELERFGSEWLLKSRVGGTPFVSAGGDVPRDAQGRPWPLLVQVNFAELGAPSPFPTIGLLQIFVPDVFGWGFTGEEPKATAVFIEAPQLAAAGLQAAREGRFVSVFSEMPLRHPVELLPSQQIAPVSPDDFRFKKLVPAAVAKKISADDDLGRAYLVLAQAAGCKLGGWPMFLQDDPRGQKPQKRAVKKTASKKPSVKAEPAAKDLESYDVLLLQLDDDNLGSTFGDGGVASVFISSEALAKKDFSDLLFHLDSM